VNEKLKIGFVSVEDANDVIPWSGTPYHLLNALRRQDVSIEVFSPLRRDFRFALAPIKIAAQLSRREIEVNRFPLALRSFARQLKQKMRQSPVDVILSTSSIPITSLQCAEPVIFYTDAIFHTMPGYYGGMWDRLTPGSVRRGIWQEEKALERCTIGVYSSKWAAEGAMRHTRPDKIRVVPFGPNMPVKHDLGTIREWVAERSLRMQSECRLLFIGADWERKGGAIALETARLLNEMGVNAKLTIAGSQPAESVPEYVELLGFIDKRSSEGRKQLEELYRRAHFFILPTRAEASAIVFCEASAFGLPTITFKTGGSGDYVHEGKSGFCLPLDSKPDLFARKLKGVLDDKKYYAELCLSAFQEYVTRLNWDSASGALVNICREAVQGRLDDQAERPSMGWGSS
jgi:glycosyltransferase involved in cell wall biosynthesis